MTKNEIFLAPDKTNFRLYLPGPHIQWISLVPNKFPPFIYNVDTFAMCCLLGFLGSSLFFNARLFQKNGSIANIQ